MPVDRNYAFPEFRQGMGNLLGAPFSAGNRLTTLSNGDEIFPAMLSAIRGAKKTITFETFVSVEGNLAQLDASTRTLGVRVRVANPERKLLPNMRATLAIVTAEADSVIAVPLSAVLGEAGNLFVFVQDEKDPHAYVRTPVVVGQRDDRYVEIVEGVLPGANVVTVGNYQLQYVTPAPAAKPADDGHGTAAPGKKSPAAPRR